MAIGHVRHSPSNTNAAGPLMAMLGKASGAMVASQVGSGLGALAGDVLSASDIGLPLGPIGKAALLPTNVAAFAEELPDVSADDVLLYLALREAAHQRLFAGVPWLRDHLIGAVSEYGAGMDFDTSGMETKLREVDMTNPEAMRENVERVLRERPVLIAGLEAAGFRPQPSVTNFVLLDLVTPERAEAAGLGLMQRGLVPRTFGHGHPLAFCLRVTVRAAEENARLIEAAREIAPTLPAIPTETAA